MEAPTVPPHVRLEPMWPALQKIWKQQPGHGLASSQRGARLAPPPEQAPEPNEPEREEPTEVPEPRVQPEQRSAVS